MSEGERFHDDMHSIFSGVGGALMLGMANACTAQAARRANDAQCAAAYEGASATVYAETAARLRQELTDERCDNLELRCELEEQDTAIARLKADLARVMAEREVLRKDIRSLLAHLDARQAA